MERLSRFTLGTTIDKIFCETIELILQASYTAREQKQTIVLRAASKLDTLKFFLQIAWEIKTIDHKKYAALSAPLHEIGKMLGGWRKQLQNNEPSQ
ncbi:MAG: four helix bundle protein [Candidatus Magasanikbacteria bacterium]|nr:four helix bundle protein [Candidatus Magasanikbacteria bacterium]